ncbi:hypothetical protein M8C21_031459 [Ambrosia artemisiifolia]|uniref:Malectin-like domain-containing protein n=1 Tax=Ambrosia artemisiifolia TaxID=4212 RepID=A0AAD5GZ28_AMBAR|nr:hypothetical protein M8C21_031459 [Ambrosia artemisiifolia]
MLILLALVLTSLLVNAQDDQSGFISIDCGIVEGSTYTDNVTNINYVSDADFIDSGEIHNILPIYNSFRVDTQLTTLRSFPRNTRNCYTLKPTQGKGNRYLIRARFMYGNYDFKGQLPEFDVYLGPDYWDTIRVNSSEKPINMEIIHVLSSDYIHVCLIDTGRGTPFISALELRLLAGNMYKETDFGSLDLFARVNFGSTFGTVRYEADKYDRLWSPIRWPNSTYNYTLDKVYTGLFTTIDPPEEKREFNIYLNGNLSYGPFSPLNHTTTTILSTEPEIVAPKYILTINKTKNSTLPPIINAIELYTLKQFPQNQTYDQDAAALWSIKSTYKINKRNWQGDPCAPQEFVWEGIGCSNNDSEFPRIVSL